MQALDKNILIAGGSGMIGQELISALQTSGYQVAILTRSPEKQHSTKAYGWSPADGTIDHQALSWADIVINLAGAGIADKPWTDRRKEEILTSRTLTTDLLAGELSKSDSRVELVINASAIGIYGHDSDLALDETAAVGSGFMAEVCEAWEASAKKFDDSNTRLCIIRIGIVLDTAGGMLAKTLPMFKYRIAHYFGSGRQVYSWIHKEDINRAVIHLIQNPSSSGIYNLTAPEPVSSKEFSRVLQKALDHKGPILPIPALGLKLGLGEMSDVILKGNTVMPSALLRENFQFAYPGLLSALKDLTT